LVGHSLEVVVVLFEQALVDFEVSEAHLKELLEVLACISVGELAHLLVVDVLGSEHLHGDGGGES